MDEDEDALKDEVPSSLFWVLPIDPSLEGVIPEPIPNYKDPELPRWVPEN